MKISQADILFFVARENDIADHWQNRWCTKFSTGRKVVIDENESPPKKIAAAIDISTLPLVIVAHGICCKWFLQTRFLQTQHTKKIAAAFLVAPAIANYEKNKLPFPSMLVASNNDPLCPFDFAKTLAKNFGSLFIDGRNNGNFNSASGHGPWPEGIMMFAEMMKKINGAVGEN